jgi:hypothetical protein
VSLSQEMLRDICNDLDPEFVRSLCIRMGWAYRDLYERLAEHWHLPDDYRNELFNKERGGIACAAIVEAAKQHGVPYEFLRLPSNGQRKLVVKAGRVVLIQEPIEWLQDAPKAADYKTSLADAHGYIRQLELDLGDRPYVVRDWSGCVLAVLLHGAVGHRFARESKDLGSLNLGVPDAAYASWSLRIDLQRIAIHGEGEPDVPKPANPPTKEGDQADKVVVKLKKKNGRSIEGQ